MAVYVYITISEKKDTKPTFTMPQFFLKLSGYGVELSARALA
jgi:hypothetical protein